ncbi:PREDICTED: uncharacterized protein LOC104587582 [Nelumbo nucifera]|uniref:Uncharacterized protein LOC104587582 n=1 Tax=Nelumbo nucifera TaxID=4432 RepID=A0A1U7YTA6_NELNU|nr:PREDICTED: uncharacterized protein LOC104587582 [Nelumbo nucifera]
MGKGLEGLTDEDRRALRGSKFAPLPLPPPPSRIQPRLAHPGGPLKTNKAAALAKFLERKLQEPGGLASINPDLLELAVKNAKDTINASGTSNSGRTIRHVTSFAESEDFDQDKDIKRGKEEGTKLKKHKRKRKKNKKQKMVESHEITKPGKRKKKSKT